MIERDEESVVLVDDADRVIGVLGKMAAHRDGGRLHRAISVFLRDAEGRMLLQRRAREKYHFGGLWTNTCCSHPRPGEDVADAAVRRLREEMGVSVALTPLFTFTYRAYDSGSGLTEWEVDHVFGGEFEGGPAPDAAEVEAWRWTTPEALQQEIADDPARFTPWFRIALERYLAERR